MPNRIVDMDSWMRSACYPRRTFYPLSFGPTMRNRRVTNACFRTCSTCRSRSQAPLCLCTLRMISNHSEGTFGRLRYSLGGLRLGIPYLEVSFPLRCFQRLSVPDIATRRCHWHDNRNTSGPSTRVLSYYGQVLARILRARQIGTELSHDVLNPARVPL